MKYTSEDSGRGRPIGARGDAWVDKIAGGDRGRGYVKFASALIDILAEREVDRHKALAAREAKAKAKAKE